MYKLITILALVLLFTASAQATVLMDETFDTGTQYADLDTLPGWVNNNGSGINHILITDSIVDDGLGIYKHDGGGQFTDYSYTIANAPLGAGEFYRFEYFVSVIDGPTNQSAAAQVLLEHSDGRSFRWFFDTAETLNADIYDGGNRINRISQTPMFDAAQTDLRLRLDLDATGVTASRDTGGGMLAMGQALATTDSRFSVTGGISNVRVKLFNYTSQDRPEADTFSLRVVPEPATLTLLTLGGLAALLRRKR